MEALLSRIIIFGSDIDQLKSFYTKNFHLAMVEETPHEWVVLDAGGIEIGLHKVGEGYLTGHQGEFRVATNTKLVFSIKGNLASFRQKLLDNGVLVKEIKSFPGIDSQFCDGEDPEGNVFQLQEWLD